MALKPSEDRPIVIAGAGAAGLAAARTLQDASLPFLILERDSSLGGRVRTDPVDLYMLDRGFQVILTSYPTLRTLVGDQVNSYRERPRGVIYRRGDLLNTVADPFKHPLKLPGTLSFPGLRPRLVIPALRLATKIFSPSASPSQSARGVLLQCRFSEREIKELWTPFFRGVFLTDSLEEVSGPFFLRTLSRFLFGRIALPCAGIQTVMEDIAAPLPKKNVLLNETIVGADKSSVYTARNGAYAYSAIITTEPECGALLSRLLGSHEFPKVQYRSTSCLYFKTQTKKRLPKFLVVQDALESRRVSHFLCQATLRNGEWIIAVTLKNGTVYKNEVVSKVKKEVVDILSFSGESLTLDFLEEYYIEKALPICTDEIKDSVEKIQRTLPALFISGDYTAEPSLEGALSSGVSAAKRVIKKALGS